MSMRHQLTTISMISDGYDAASMFWMVQSSYSKSIVVAKVTFRPYPLPKNTATEMEQFNYMCCILNHVGWEALGRVAVLAATKNRIFLINVIMMSAVVHHHLPLSCHLDQFRWSPLGGHEASSLVRVSSPPLETLEVQTTGFDINR